jgi:hypothetical protein
VAASLHGDTPYSGNSLTSVSVTPYTTSVDVNCPGRAGAHSRWRWTTASKVWPGRAGNIGVGGVDVEPASGGLGAEDLHHRRGQVHLPSPASDSRAPRGHPGPAESIRGAGARGSVRPPGTVARRRTAPRPGSGHRTATGCRGPSRCTWRDDRGHFLVHDSRFEPVPPSLRMKRPAGCAPRCPQPGAVRAKCLGPYLRVGIASRRGRSASALASALPGCTARSLTDSSRPGSDPYPSRLPLVPDGEDCGAARSPDGREPWRLRLGSAARGGSTVNFARGSPHLHWWAASVIEAGVAGNGGSRLRLRSLEPVRPLSYCQERRWCQTAGS